MTIKSAIKKIIQKPIIVLRLLKRYLMFPLILKDFLIFKKQSKNNKRFSIPLHRLSPQIADKTKITEINYHYIYHPAWAARILAKNKPQEHIDISSFLHFSTMVSAFIPIKFYDYRPADVKLSGLYCGRENLLNLSFADNSIKSLSCMHTIEHIGLGRYGDALDPDGDLKAIAELKRVLAPGGSLLFVTPLSGYPRIEFNANRVYSYQQIVNYFQDLYLEEFSLIVQEGPHAGLVFQATEELANQQNNGCGCFWFIKK
jgi:SAM-dependent methyltransferase